jgi:hypothetical protein
MLTTTATIVSLIPLTPITLSNQYIFSRCTSKSSYDVPSMTKIMALQMTSMSSRQHTPHQLALEQLTTSRRSHVASVRSDTPKDFKRAIEKYDGRSDPSIWLKMYNIAARACRGNEDHMARYFPPRDGQSTTPVARQSFRGVHHFMGDLVTTL